MIQSMTGFASRVAKVTSLGSVCVELRSTNHKFFDIVFHLPEGFLSLEEGLRKEVEAKIKRGRVVCNINIIDGQTAKVFINKKLLKTYHQELKNIKKQFSTQDNVSIDTLIHLPGVLSLSEAGLSKALTWPRLKALISQAVDDLVKVRSKEGRALYGYLKGRSGALKTNLEAIKTRFKKVIKERLAQIKTNEERASFLKDSDITEEIERLSFHIHNFENKLSKAGPIGKELDFIAQEMQRETNTAAAKSFDIVISGRAIQIKSQLEKIREQLQNVE